ncbi:hypothetical protein M0802_004706 [Mischocyttarus mexicanus]|nr:hypothetical protein M0802_004706 [Mischocyttarus mexicanus]
MLAVVAIAVEDKASLRWTMNRSRNLFPCALVEASGNRIGRAFWKMAPSGGQVTPSTKNADVYSLRNYRRVYV